MNKLDRKKLNSNLWMIGLFTITSFLSVTYIVFQKIDSSNVLGASTNVSAIVYGCRLDILAQPEARSVGNWSTYLQADIYSNDGTSNLGNFTVTTDNFGFASINLCELPTPILLDEGIYKLKIKGYSHLAKVIETPPVFSEALTMIDLTDEGELNTGDVNTPPDDEVNSLDSSDLIRTLGSVDGLSLNYNEKYDLNLDGEISLSDIEVLITNFYKTGENIN